MYYKVKYHDIAVSYLPELDGGGIAFGQQYLRVIKDKLGKVEHLFEYCAGPGFIGFSLLANGICDKLTLADINPAAVKAVQQTILENNLQDRVSVYQSDCLDSIPATEKWDLVVSNPPHWPGSDDDYHANIRLVDPDFIIHKKFYRDINKFLKPDGSIIFQENGQATRRDEFVPMAESNGLKVVEIFDARPADNKMDRIQLGKLVPKLPAAFVHKMMGPVEKVLMNPKVERLIKDNDAYRRLQALPIFQPTQFYFIWSKPDLAAAGAASPKREQTA